MGQLFIGGFSAAILLTLLYAIESVVFGVFSGAPSSPLGRVMGSWLIVVLALANAIAGIGCAYFYTLLSRGFLGSRAVRGMKFGVCAWAIGSLFYIPFLYFNVALPLWVLGGWVVALLVNLTLAGAVIGLLVDVRE